MNRRRFFTKALTGTLGVGLGISAVQTAAGATGKNMTKSIGRTVSTTGHQVSYHVQGLKQAVKVLHVSDTHLFLDDARGEAFSKYSARMAKAYNQTTHWQTGEPTNPEKAFEETLVKAKELDVDLLGLSGDIFSFPSEAAVEWVLERLEKSGLNYLYTTGNHDWHYEGMEGTSHELRATWSEKRLKPLFQGENPLMAAREIKGVTFLSMDNSNYEITAEQLSFFVKHKQTGKPLVVLVHIPMYAPGRSVGYGCGHPDWGWDVDRNYDLEGRVRWPKEGHTEVTRAFHREVFSSPTLLGVFAGHVHRQTVDLVNGIPQFVTAPNATGAFLELSFEPMSERDSALFS
nr:metallophosphoesterase [Cytophagales bacterium]